MKELTEFLSKHTDLMLKFTSDGVSKAAALFLSLFLARQLGLAGYAAIGNANLIVAATLPLLTCGLGYSLIRSTAGFRDRRQSSPPYYTALGFTALLSILFVILIWSASISISDWLFNDTARHGFVFLIAIYGMATVLDQLIAEFVRARQLIKISGIIQIYTSLVSLTACLVVYFLDSLTPTNMLLIMIIARIQAALISHMVLVKLRHISAAPIICSNKRFRTALVFGWPFALSGFGTWIIEQGDRFILMAFVSQEEFAKYLAALVILSIIPMCGAPFWYILFPKMTALFSKKKSIEMITEGRDATGNYLVVIVPVSLFLGYALPELLPLLAGPDFQIEPVTAGLLVASLLTTQISTAFEYASIAHGAARSLLYRTLLFGIASLFACTLFGYFWSITGVALGAFLARLALSVSYYRLSASLGFGYTMLPSKNLLITIGAMSVIVFAITTGFWGVQLFVIRSDVARVTEIFVFFGAIMLVYGSGMWISRSYYQTE